MFEKEAEERCSIIDALTKAVIQDVESYKLGRLDGFKDGAEYGYNKANEWHYVQDELPDEGTYLVVWQNNKGYKEVFVLKYEEDDEEELHWVDGDYEIQDEYVIAWKEIVLPKDLEHEK